MGARNAMAAYTKFASLVPLPSLVCLVYMALISMDSDDHPWFGKGHEALAEHALGRPLPITESDLRAVRRAVAPLVAAKAIVVDRRGAVRIDGANTIRYRLQLGEDP
jgi:hypothetical protein